ncbi:hypothetical protein J7E45_09385 [Microbacterium sp. ISL-59]|uniref:hypothetical protein n=1 Tax=Microbacterium sp. ISL-59 TaxID=2819159 RepID=UPI001BE963EA|nr:hypothetical protein [Microbacterium sp. ISL-59]MBT2495820.1 hypothetical protein [Microbacterium sp. ISL-59]
MISIPRTSRLKRTFAALAITGVALAPAQSDSPDAFTEQIVVEGNHVTTSGGVYRVAAGTDIGGNMLGVDTHSFNSPNRFSVVDRTTNALDDEIIVDREDTEYLHAVVTESGKVFRWGAPENGLGGNGQPLSSFREPTELPLAGTAAESERVVDLAVSEHAAWLLTEAGSVVAWGSNVRGVLGIDGAPGAIHAPTNVPFPAPVTRILPLYQATLFELEDGSLLATGDVRATTGSFRYSGGVVVDDGSGYAVPTPVSFPEFGEHRIANTASTMGRWGSDPLFPANAAVLDNGELYTWGVSRADYGTLGNGKPGVQVHARPTMVGENFEGVYGGGDAAFTALSVDRSVYAWGNNLEGQAGNGTTRHVLAPHRTITGVELFTTQHSPSHAVVLTNGELRVWGKNNWGNLGPGSGSISSPTRVDMSKSPFVGAKVDAIRSLGISFGTKYGNVLELDMTYSPQ